MEKVCEYYEIAASEECALILCHKKTATKLQVLGYGLVVMVIVSKRKAVKNTRTRVTGSRIVIKEIAVH